MSVFACSDLHGMFNLYKQIKNFLKPEDKVYCLGDCGAFFTGKTVLLDLDTFDEHIFSI